MIYKNTKGWLLKFLKAPMHPPDPPAGSQASLQVFRAAPNFLKYQVIIWGFGFAVGILIAFVYMIVELISAGGDREARWGGIAAATALIVLSMVGSVIKYFLIRIDYDMRYYVVTDRSLRIRQGAVIIDESTFTFANVQNLKIHQGPIERLLGLSNLVVETAGGAGGGAKEGQGQSPFRRGHEGQLRGVENAREVRDQILKLLKQYRDAGLGDPEDRRHAGHGGGRTGISPAAIERLREIRLELQLLRQES
ncbi:MAG: PH domain-containing protein [Planctomycetota bacterium]